VDVREPEDLAAFRAEARTWLEANAPAKGAPGDFTKGRELDFVEGCRRWQRTLFDAGWAGLTWPDWAGGRGLSVLHDVAFKREQAHYGVSGAAFDVGIGMVGPTLMVHGTESQKDRHLSSLLCGEEVWCQMFSEPGAGSDLAGLSTRAERVGDRWVVNGQKVWTSYARFADFAILLAHSDPDRPRHRGITCFALDMTSPGIEVRPIRQMNGAAEFNEVFLTDVEVPDSAVVGEVHGGWAVAATMLGSERGLVGEEFPGVADLIDAARQAGQTGDPLLRQEIARAHIRAEILHFLDLRIQTALSRGTPVGALPSVVNLTFAASLRHIGDVAAALSGPEVLAAAPHAGTAGRFAFMVLTAPSVRIASGTDEIQRNIIAERTLGLPRDPRPQPS
jgi:alkylation response protein AidB-like acyl-CoA dehydrogenase